MGILTSPPDSTANITCSIERYTNITSNINEIQLHLLLIVVLEASIYPFNRRIFLQHLNSLQSTHSY